VTLSEQQQTDEPVTAPAQAPTRWRVALARVRTALAAILVYLALVAPDDYGHLTPLAFLRLPLEGLLGAALLLALRGRPRRVSAAVLGALLGVLAILKIIDINFWENRGRPFNLALDWSLFGPAIGVVKDTVGRAGQVAAVTVAVLLIVVVPVLMTRSLLRLTTLADRHRAGTTRTIAALGVAWLTLGVLGARYESGLPVADHGTSAMVYDRAVQLHAGLHDLDNFRAQRSVDAFGATPGGQLLTGLRGKDVIFAFVESYGRSAVEDPSMGPGVDAVLDQGTQELKDAGFGARTGFLTSATFGGGSWLAHSTLMSGLWVNDQNRYHDLLQSKRQTLPSLFTRAGWRTSSWEPAIMGSWPERIYYGYQKGYDRPSIDYHGPQFSYAPIPDQYTFAQLQKDERAPGHKPIMAEVTLVSSHTPFTPVPRLLPWDGLGDGSVYADPANRLGGSGSSVLGGGGKLREAYAASIRYTLSTLISYVRTYGDKNLVLVFLGDHQPSQKVTGPNPSLDVPITVVAGDQAVLDRIGGWGWTDGLRPDPHAPVWPMDTFRDRFLTAFAR
jgi:Sulfatase